MKNRIDITCLLLSFLLANYFPSFSQSEVKRISIDHFEIIFENENIDSISFLQVTDLHFGNDWLKDLKVTRHIRQMVKENRPDFIIITGDLFTGEKDKTSYVFPFAADCFEALELPWLFVFGNHDPEGNVGREPIRALFNNTKLGIIGFHEVAPGSIACDFLVDLKLKNQQQPAWQVYAFDSGSEPGNKSIKADQLSWYQNLSHLTRTKYQQIIPAIALFHIPIKQYQMLWKDSSLPKKGFRHERECFEEDDGSVYQAFLEQQNIRACFCGHDHDNNFWGKYKGGILLVYGHVTGEACYHRHWPPGGKLIKLPVKGGEISIKDEIVVPE